MIDMTIEQQYLFLAVTVAKANGGVFKKYFGHVGQVMIKNNDPRNLVTKVDRQIETNIRAEILKKFPDAKIIGEEFGGCTLAKNDIVWIIDPIDGTTNYIRGIPLCCISIGVWDSKGPLLGVVYNPVTEQIYTALRGKSAFLNGKRIKVSNISKLSEASGGIGWLNPTDGKKMFNSIIDDARKVRVLATSSWQTCLVASGQFDYYTTKYVNIWDVAGPLAILKEAGGKFTDFKGNILKINLKEIIASNGKIQSELVKKLAN